MAEVQRLHARGLNRSQIASATGVSRDVVRAWTDERFDAAARVGRRAGKCMRCSDYRFPVPRIGELAYAQLLGLYLGDGSISRHPRGVFRLRVTLDRAYPAIVAECAALMSILLPDNVVSVYHSRRDRTAEPNSSSRHWPCLFPQHGPGRKHHRRIVLEPWQREILDRRPWRFLRGLIQSDGYRGMNTIHHPNRTYAYPRYQFSNRSDDIRGLFCEYCDVVGVRWRRMNRWTISVARRESVALMDRYIGPKR